MRKFFLTLFCLGAVLTLDATAELNIRFVNSEIILQQYRAVQGVVETFNRDVQGWNDEAQRRKREIEELQRELESQSLMLSNERRQEKDMEYQRRLNEYEQYVQSIWGPEGLVEQRNEELLRPIINKVQTLLAQIAADEGYDFILDAADNNILYADPEHDLTQDIVDLLNSEEVGD